MTSNDIMNALNKEQQKADAYRKERDKLSSQLPQTLENLDGERARHQKQAELQGRINDFDQKIDWHNKEVARLTREYDQAVQAEKEAAAEKQAAEAKEKRQKNLHRASTFLGF